MLNILISILAFIVAIGILVTFHEFGHFWVARRLGVKVLRFSFGFGKPLWKWHDKQHTEYVISALPLGGYVKMLDEREEAVPNNQKHLAFNRKPLWVRFSIVSAGPIFNFIFAVIAYWLMYVIGISGSIPLIGEVLPHSIAATASLKAGEEIISLDGQATPTWQKVNKQLMDRLGDKGILAIDVKTPNGEIKHHYLGLQSWELKGNRPNLLHALGIEPYQMPIIPVVAEVLSDEPAGLAGFQPHDVIKSVNGKAITSWQEFTHVVANSPDKLINVIVLRNDQIHAIQLRPRAKESGTGEIIGFAGLTVKAVKMAPHLMRHERLGPWDAFTSAVMLTGENAYITLKLIGKMVIGEIGLRTLSGPLTVAQGAGATAIVGIQYYLGFLALISVSLGVLNLLPIPILDGGHLLYYLVEMIIRRPVSQRVQLYGFKLGLVLLIFLMCIAFYNDISRLF